MAYRVDTLDTLFGSIADDDDAAHDAVRIEAALNTAEAAGWSLVQHLPQYRSWDDEGHPAGMNEQLFVFHKPHRSKSGVIH